MKKSILLFLLALFSCMVLKAQEKPKADTAKKVPAPVYSADLVTTHDITLKGLTLSQLNNYLVFEQYGQQLDSTDKLTGAQITAIKKDALTVIQQISKGFSDLLAGDKAKWEKAQKTKK